MAAPAARLRPLLRQAAVRPAACTTTPEIRGAPAADLDYQRTWCASPRTTTSPGRRPTGAGPRACGRRRRRHGAGRHAVARGPVRGRRVHVPVFLGRRPAEPRTAGDERARLPPARCSPRRSESAGATGRCARPKGGRTSHGDQLLAWSWTDDDGGDGDGGRSPGRGQPGRRPGRGPRRPAVDRPRRPALAARRPASGEVFARDGDAWPPRASTSSWRRGATTSSCGRPTPRSSLDSVAGYGPYRRWHGHDDPDDHDGGAHGRDVRRGGRRIAGAGPRRLLGRVVPAVPHADPDPRRDRRRAGRQAADRQGRRRRPPRPQPALRRDEPAQPARLRRRPAREAHGRRPGQAPPVAELAELADLD